MTFLLCYTPSPVILPGRRSRQNQVILQMCFGRVVGYTAEAEIFPTNFGEGTGHCCALWRSKAAGSLPYVLVFHNARTLRPVNGVECFPVGCRGKRSACHSTRACGDLDGTLAETCNISHP